MQRWMALRKRSLEIEGIAKEIKLLAKGETKQYGGICIRKQAGVLQDESCRLTKLLNAAVKDYQRVISNIIRADDSLNRRAHSTTDQEFRGFHGRHAANAQQKMA